MSTITIKGSKKGGYIITVMNKKEQFKDDIAMTYEEMVLLVKEIKKKLTIVKTSKRSD